MLWLIWRVDWSRIPSYRARAVCKERWREPIWVQGRSHSRKSKFKKKITVILGLWSTIQSESLWWIFHLRKPWHVYTFAVNAIEKKIKVICWLLGFTISSPPTVIIIIYANKMNTETPVSSRQRWAKQNYELLICQYSKYFSFIIDFVRPIIHSASSMNM